MFVIPRLFLLSIKSSLILFILAGAARFSLKSRDFWQQDHFPHSDGFCTSNPNPEERDLSMEIPGAVKSLELWPLGGSRRQGVPCSRISREKRDGNGGNSLFWELFQSGALSWSSL